MRWGQRTLQHESIKTRIIAALGTRAIAGDANLPVQSFARTAEYVATAPRIIRAALRNCRSDRLQIASLYRLL